MIYKLSLRIQQESNTGADYKYVETYIIGRSRKQTDGPKICRGTDRGPKETRRRSTTLLLYNNIYYFSIHN